jgi:PAS domain S-box-containing protein
MDSILPGNPYKDIFYNSLSPLLIIGIDAPFYSMLDVNNAYLSATNTRREDLIGKSVFGVFPANPTDNVSRNIERTIFSFEEAIKNKVPHVMSNYRYDIPVPGSTEFEERYWTTSNTPVMDDEGNVLYLIHSPSNVTELYKLAQREKAGLDALKNQEQQLYSTFMQAPVGIVILKGSNYIVDLINPPLCELYGKKWEELIGKPIFDVLPSAKASYEPLLDKVRLTGEVFKGTSLTVPLERNDNIETVYVNFVYEPFRQADGNIIGVIAVATEVTELVNAKNQVEEAEARARLAVDAAELGTFDLDLVSGEMITSDQFAHIFGFEHPVSRSEYISIFHKDDLQLRKDAHAAAIVTGKLLYEARVIWKDESVHWVRVEGKVFYNEEGKAVRIPGILLDITGQRKALDEQRKLISLVENSVDLMSILKLDGYNSYINEAGLKLLGFESIEQVSKIPVRELHTPEDFIQVEEEVIPSVMQKGSWSGTMMVRHLQTGEVFPVFNNCFRIDDPESGETIAVGAVMRDMRPELAAKQALEDSEQLLRKITSATPTALWMSDEDGNITYVNQTWVEWSGLSYEENLGQGWLKPIVEEDKKKAAEKFIHDLRARGYYEVEFRINHTDGSIHWCIANGQPQYRTDGTFYGYIGACVDITEQKNLQQQKDDFIGIASHELKTPVTSIKGYAQVLEKMLQKKGDVKEAMMMNRMDAQIRRLTNLIGDLLDVTKINSGKLQFNDAPFDFNSMVKDLVEDLQRTTEKHELIEDLHDAGLVFGDKERISQVITNLVTNAIKYSPAADKIIIHTSREANEVILCVEDYGIGIPPDKLENVFEQFYRVSGDMQHTFPGLGLGLYISSEIIKRENGRIWVNSVEGKGSTFCFALPLYKT